MVSRLLAIQFLKLIKFINLLYIHIKTGLSESTLKPFSCLSHCKVSCDSPCCTKLCGEDNHCNVNIDTHEHISDSEEEQIEKK